MVPEDATIPETPRRTHCDPVRSLPPAVRRSAQPNSRPTPLRAGRSTWSPGSYAATPPPSRWTPESPCRSKPWVRPLRNPARNWANDLGELGLNQFALPWADSDPLATQAIDTLLYARLGQYPWLHSANITGPQLESLAQRSAEAVLVPSTVVDSDRTVVQYGAARMIRVDQELSDALRDATIAASQSKQRPRFNAFKGWWPRGRLARPERFLVVDTGRLPATAISLRLEDVLDRLQNVEFVDIVQVPWRRRQRVGAGDQRIEPAAGVQTNLSPASASSGSSDVRYAHHRLQPGIGRGPEVEPLPGFVLVDLADQPPSANKPSGSAHKRTLPRSKIRSMSSRAAPSPCWPTGPNCRSPFETTCPRRSRFNWSVSPSRGILRVEQPTISVVVPPESFQRVSVPVRSLANGHRSGRNRPDQLGGLSLRRERHGADYHPGRVGKRHHDWPSGRHRAGVCRRYLPGYPAAHSRTGGTR